MVRVITTKSGDVRVALSTTIRKDLYDRLVEYAKLFHGGRLSSALDEILDAYFKVVKYLPSRIEIVKAVEKDVTEEKAKSRKKSESSEDKELKEVVNEAVYVEVRDKLADYVNLLKGFAQQLHNFILGKRFNRPTVKPDFTHIRKKLDEIRKEVQKVLKDKSIPKTQELKDLIEDIRDLM